MIFNPRFPWRILSFSIWHLFWHPAWHIFRQCSWHSWHFIPHSIWHSLWHATRALYLTYILAWIWHILWHFIWRCTWLLFFVIFFFTHLCGRGRCLLGCRTGCILASLQMCWMFLGPGSLQQAEFLYSNILSENCIWQLGSSSAHSVRLRSSCAPWTPEFSVLGPAVLIGLGCPWLRSSGANCTRKVPGVGSCSWGPAASKAIRSWRGGDESAESQKKMKRQQNAKQMQQNVAKCSEMDEHRLVNFPVFF